jgi:hypothetical protein
MVGGCQYKFLAVFIGIALAKISTAPDATLSPLFQSLSIAADSCAVVAAPAWGIYSNPLAKLSHPFGALAVPIYMRIAGLRLLLVSQATEPRASLTINDWYLRVGWALASGLPYVSWDVGMQKGAFVSISVASMFIPLFSTVITAVLSGTASWCIWS